jgi:rhomboid protease GluP
MMKDIAVKLKILFLPFLILSILLITGYSWLRWLLDIHLKILPLKDDLLNFWLPFFAPWLLVVLCMRRRVRILDVAGKNNNGYFGYQLVMGLSISIPLIISQFYLEKAAFSLHPLDSVHQLTEYPGEKYFQLDTFAVDKSQALAYVTGRTSGRHNERLTFYLYLACPLDTLTYTSWYAVKYSEGMSSRASDAEKEQTYEAFIESSWQAFNQLDCHQVSYFVNLPYSDDRDGFTEAVKTRFPAVDKTHLFILEPEPERFDARLGNMLLWVLGSYAIGVCIIGLMVTIPRLHPMGYGDYLDKVPVADEDFDLYRQYLNPFGKYPATAVLLLANILVFISMVLAGMNVVSPTPQELLQIGANRRQEVLSGEYWRLFTAMFIHKGLMHVAMNLFALGIAAALLEPTLKFFRLLLLYLIGGVAASLASIYWYDNITSLGASGAIFGLYGLLLAFNVTRVFAAEQQGVVWIVLLLFGGLSLLLGFLGGVDNAAHIGGLISGFILGMLISLMEGKRLRENSRYALD